MKSLRANLSRHPSNDRRGAARWRVELILTAGKEHELSTVLVRNLSEKGLMLQTDATLEVGERIVVELPGAEDTQARIVWRQEFCYGCEFVAPIPSAAVSSILLKAPLSSRDCDLPDSGFEEIPVAVSPSIARLAEWKAEFERTRGAEGYRIIAYRQTTGGLLIAIAGRVEETQRG